MENYYIFSFSFILLFSFSLSFSSSKTFISTIFCSGFLIFKLFLFLISLFLFKFSELNFFSPNKSIHFCNPSLSESSCWKKLKRFVLSEPLTLILLNFLLNVFINFSCFIFSSSSESSSSFSSLNFYFIFKFSSSKNFSLLKDILLLSLFLINSI